MCNFDGWLKTRFEICEYLPKRYLVFSLCRVTTIPANPRDSARTKNSVTQASPTLSITPLIFLRPNGPRKREKFSRFTTNALVYLNAYLEGCAIRWASGRHAPTVETAAACLAHVFIERARISRFERPVECREFVAGTISRCRVQLFVQSAIPSYDIAIYVSQYRLLIIKNEYKNYIVLLNI